MDLRFLKHTVVHGRIILKFRFGLHLCDSEHGPVATYFEHINEPSSSIDGGRLFHHPSNCWHFTKDAGLGTGPSYLVRQWVQFCRVPIDSLFNFALLQNFDFRFGYSIFVE
jgi:hypothetical protein